MNNKQKVIDQVKIVLRELIRDHHVRCGNATFTNQFEQDVLAAVKLAMQDNLAYGFPDDFVEGCSKHNSQGFLCTLPVGHSGVHIAQSSDGKVLAQWPDKLGIKS